MTKISKQPGFSTIESLLVIAIVAIVGFVGWYVYHSKHQSDKALDTATTTSNNAGPRFGNSKQAQTTGNGSDNQSLQADLNSINSTNSQSVQNLSASSSSLNDQSTFTSVPQ